MVIFIEFLTHHKKILLVTKMPQNSKIFKNDFTKSQLPPRLQGIKNRGLS